MIGHAAVRQPVYVHLSLAGGCGGCAATHRLVGWCRTLLRNWEPLVSSPSLWPLAMRRQSGPGSDGSYSIFRPIVVLLGDSITEFGSNEGGWHQQLTRDYTRKVRPAGFAGPALHDPADENNRSMQGTRPKLCHERQAAAEGGRRRPES